ncbi:MAG: hypothetical protein RLZZ271_1672 [Pseudomonadota bacterium]|jgi:hypothetical protein
MSIRQLNVSYVQEQDRILLRVSTSRNEELSIWLTRYLLLRFLPELDKVIAELAAKSEPKLASTDPLSKQMLAEFQKEENLKSTDFKSPYQHDQLTPLLEGQPLLVTQVGMSIGEKNTLALALTETLQGKQRKAEIKLNEQLYHGLASMLRQGMSKANWLGGTTEADKSPAIAPANRPQYLN